MPDLGPQSHSAFTVCRFEPEDADAIRDLIISTYGRGLEAQLVDDLRNCGMMVLELVAKNDRGELLGHVVLSRVTGAGPAHTLNISCLAPLSVSSEMQREGIGSALVNEALDRLRGLGEDLVLTLGPPSYFPRFGFDAELAKKVTGPYAGPVFMALPLTAQGRSDLPAEVTYPTPFADMG